LAESSISRLKERLNKARHQKELAVQKAKMLEEQTVRDKEREGMLTQVLQQLMDRQRELNVMLNRANLMLNRAQETNAILSLEFSELCHALPAPEDPEVKDRIQRISDLFKRTGADDVEISNVAESTVEQPSVIVTPPPHAEVQTEEPAPREPAAAPKSRRISPEPVPEPIIPEPSQLFSQLFGGEGKAEPPVAEEPAIASSMAAETNEGGYGSSSEPEPVETVSQGQEGIPSSARQRRWWRLLTRR
jgi:hypothetical protein